MKFEQGKCPKCESEDLYYGIANIDEGLDYPFTCNECGFQGTEVYGVKFQGFFNKSGEKIGDW